MAQGFLQSVLKTSKNRDCTVFLGILYHCCTVSLGRKFSLCLESELVLFQLVPVVSHPATVTEPGFVLSVTCLQAGGGFSDAPPKPSLLQAEAALVLRVPSLEGAPALEHPGGPLLGLLQFGSVLDVGAQTTGLSILH